MVNSPLGPKRKPSKRRLKKKLSFGNVTHSPPKEITRKDYTIVEDHNYKIEWTSFGLVYIPKANSVLNMTKEEQEKIFSRAKRRRKMKNILFVCPELKFDTLSKGFKDYIQLNHLDIELLNEGSNPTEEIIQKSQYFIFVYEFIDSNRVNLLEEQINLINELTSSRSISGILLVCLNSKQDTIINSAKEQLCLLSKKTKMESFVWKKRDEDFDPIIKNIMESILKTGSS